ncbi:MAG: hypothetical protein ABSG94_11720, partial [Brevinematales bacterium]
LISASAPMEGAPSGTRPVLIQLKGYAEAPSKRKINVDGVVVSGWAVGDFTGRKIMIKCTGMSYYDYNNSPRYSDINGFVSYRGMEGIVADSIISHEGEQVAMAAIAGAMEALAKWFQGGNLSLGGLTGNTNFSSGTVIEESGSSSFSQISSFYLKMAAETLPEIVVINGKDVQVTWLSPIEFYTKDFVEK